MIDRFQGDPKIVVDENGATLVFKGGQPIMDQGLENAVTISLHTKEGWCGNTLLRDPNERIGSKFEESLNQPITLSALTAIRAAGIKALQWMVDTKLAARVEVVARNPVGTQLQTLTVILPPSRELLTLLSIKNGLNWIVQKTDPAHLKV